MLFRLVIFAALIAVLYVVIRAILRQQQEPNKPKSSSKTNETMVKCAQCGLHIPVSSAVTDKQQLHFCSQEHLDEYHQE